MCLEDLVLGLCVKGISLYRIGGMPSSHKPTYKLGTVYGYGFIWLQI